MSEVSLFEERSCEVIECTNCGTIIKDDEIDKDNTLYECNQCGNVFSKEDSEFGNNRCECGKFASKLADFPCPECGEDMGNEVETRSDCPHCDTWFDDEDEFNTHVARCGAQ